MGIYFSKIRALLEVKRKIDGREEDLEELDKNEEINEEEANENDEKENSEGSENNSEKNSDEEDEHQIDDSASDYNMEIEDDETENEKSSDDTQEIESEGEEDENSDNTESSDYSMDIDDSENSDEEESDEDNEGETENSEENNEEEVGDSEDGTDELKSLENDLFKDITPEQMNIKILELKKQYLEVYSTITDVLTRTNKIQKTTQNIKVLEFIISKLMELKDIVQFYLSNTFDTKSYMENMVNYQQYLVALNTINRLLKEINVKKGK